MPILLSLAARNLRRNRARTAITLAAIFFGAFLGTLLGGLVLSVQRTLKDQVVRGRTGALQVYRRGWFDHKGADPLSLDIEQGGALERRILSVPGVEAAAPRIPFNALANNGSAAAMTMATGVDPAAERRVLPQGAELLRGGWAGEGGPQRAVLGAGLAKALGLAPGSAWVLQAATRDGRQNALDVELAGTEETANIWESSLKAVVTLEVAQKLLHMPGRVVGYAVSVREGADVDEVARGLRAALGDEYDVRTWRELAPYISDIFLFQRALFGLVSAVFLVVAVIGVMNTMIMSVLERTREIGMMMAAGLKRRWITALLLLEAVVLALVGGLAGIAGGVVALRIVVSRGGITLKIPGSTMPMLILPEVPVRFCTGLGIVVICGALVAAAWPARRAARMTPADALRDA